MASVMKALCTAAGIVGIALLPATVRAQGTVVQTISDGDSGGLSGRDASHEVFAYVTRSADASGQRSTWMFFEIDEADATALGGYSNVLFGSGTIPDGDLSVDGLGNLKLDTDTAANATFTTYSCPLPRPAAPPYCFVVPNAGRVSMTLTHDNSRPVFHNSGQWTWDLGTLHFEQTGTQESSAATGQGVVAGISFPDGATGSIGQNREVYVVIQQGQ